jgi:hypothetical protein
MKLLRVILSIAIPAIILLADAAIASASIRDGTCCRWAGRGTSYRYQEAVMRAHTPHSCSGYAASCAWYSNEHGYGAYGTNICHAAGAQCLRTGVYVGPFSGRHFAGMPRT